MKPVYGAFNDWGYLVIQFLLNNTPITMEHCVSNISLLDWLRTEASKVGTKEGCATGDCGACTVLVGAPEAPHVTDSPWRYKSVNSCLMSLANIHGKHIVTIEAVTPLANPSLEQLHPVQRAMVECHGSQCGFCTPGFIMSMLALYLSHEQYPGDKATIHALGGNLCRCTGYRPILEAARRAFEYPRVGHDWQALTNEFVRSLSSCSDIPSISAQEKTFYVPQTIEQLLTLKAKYPAATLVAGGTDISLEFSQQLTQPEILISTTQVASLSELTITKATLHIGAACCYSDLLEPLCNDYPEARELFERLGATQVRNTGTLGGSLGNASPIGDPAPLLIALKATMELQSVNGKREIPVEDFFTGYRQTVLKDDEVICQINIPRRSDNTKLACYKISKRFEDDISTVCLVAAIGHNNNIITECSIAAGGMAAIPKRASQAEQSLIGKALTTESFIAASAVIEQDFTPLSDVRASAQYRMLSTQNLLKRMGHELCRESIDITEINSVRVEHAAL